MRSVRLEDELERRIEQASEASGQSASEIIRGGIRKECDEILKNTLHDRLKDWIGCLSSTATERRRTNSRRTGEAFKKLLVRDRKKLK